MNNSNADFVGLVMMIVAIISLLVIAAIFDPFDKTNNVYSSVDLNPKCIVEVEGCEYFKVFADGGCSTYVHKGNCKNPIHMYNK